MAEVNQDSQSPFRELGTASLLDLATDGPGMTWPDVPPLVLFPSNTKQGGL